MALPPGLMRTCKAHVVAHQRQRGRVPASNSAASILSAQVVPREVTEVALTLVDGELARNQRRLMPASTLESPGYR